MNSDPAIIYGSVKRVTKPPGGDTSDIFSTKPLSTPPSTPRKTNHMSSNIFAPVDAPTVPRKTVDNSFNKLFGEITVSNGNTGTVQAKVTSPTPAVASPRVVKDHQKSNIFFVADKEGQNGSPNPVLNGRASPKIIGDSHDSASSSGNSSGCVTPSGSATPPNGSVNGDEPLRNALGQSAPAVNGTPKKVRVPPGGHSTKLW